jgi:hypothetical protein
METGVKEAHETPLFRSATEAIRRKEISSRELTEMLLPRIKAVNPAVNAVVELRHEAALQEAIAADEATARGDDAGALHGVPMTIKDSFNVAGLHTTWGNPAFKDFVADSDATVARRLRRSGAFIIGKTNVAFMLGDFGQTANDLYGVRKKGDTEVIRVRVEIHEGALAYRVQVTAPSIERALEIAGVGKPGCRVRLIFPIDPEAFFVSAGFGNREAA